MRHHLFEDSPIPAPYGGYSHAVEAGDFVFLAGQIARDSATGELIEGDAAAQTTRCLEIIREILERLGLTLDHVVRSTVYLANIDDFAAMDGAYRKAFQGSFPARSTPQVKLPRGALVGIEVTAFRGGNSL
jgi:2-iminobutanoate/2-iminopropanoate deaminase